MANPIYLQGGVVYDSVTGAVLDPVTFEPVSLDGAPVVLPSNVVQSLNAGQNYPAGYVPPVQLTPQGYAATGPVSGASSGSGSGPGGIPIPASLGGIRSWFESLSPTGKLVTVGAGAWVLAKIL